MGPNQNQSPFMNRSLLSGFERDRDPLMRMQKKLHTLGPGGVRSRISAGVKQTYPNSTASGLTPQQRAAEDLLLQGRYEGKTTPPVVSPAEIAQERGSGIPNDKVAYAKGERKVFADEDYLKSLEKNHGIGRSLVLNHEFGHADAHAERDRLESMRDTVPPEVFRRQVQPAIDRINSMSEVGTTIGDIAMIGQREKMVGNDAASDIQVDLTGDGVRRHSLGWMADQAKQHGYFAGKSMDELLATPEGQQWLSMHSRGVGVTPSSQPFTSQQSGPTDMATAPNRRGGVAAPRNTTTPQGRRQIATPPVPVPPAPPGVMDTVVKPLARQGASILGTAGGVQGGIVDPALSAVQQAADSLLAPSAPKPPAVAPSLPAMNPLAGIAADRAGIVVPSAPSALRPPMPANPVAKAASAMVAPSVAAASPAMPPVSVPQNSAAPRQSMADIEAQAEREFMSNLEADPTRQRLNAERAAGIAAMQATQGRLAQSGAAALGGSPAVPGVDEGLQGRMTGIGDALNNRALRGSGIAGNMQGSRFNTGSTAFAGPGADMLEVQPRQSSFDDARRQAAIQMMGSDPNAVASRERMQATYGPVADPSVVLAGGLPAMARRNDLTSQQKMAFADRRNAFRDERDRRMAASAGWRAQRAQAQRGFMTNADGELDQLATLGLRDPRMAVAARQAQMTQDEAARRATVEGRRLDLLENEQEFNQDPARIDEQIRIRSTMTPAQQLEFDAKQMEMEDIRKQRAQQPVMDAVEGNRELRELGVDEQIERFGDVKAAMSAGGMPAALEAAAAYTDDQLQAMLEYSPWFGSGPDEATKQVIAQILAERKKGQGATPAAPQVDPRSLWPSSPPPGA
jgi:hypothetical protein